MSPRAGGAPWFCVNSSSRAAALRAEASFIRCLARPELGASSLEHEQEHGQEQRARPSLPEQSSAANRTGKVHLMVRAGQRARALALMKKQFANARTHTKMNDRERRAFESRPRAPPIARALIHARL